MRENPFVSAISGLLTVYPAAYRVGAQYGLSNHRMRVLLAIYYLQQTSPKGVTQRRVSRYTYFFLPVVMTAVKFLISQGIIEELKEPDRVLRLTQKGNFLLAEVEAGFKKQIKILNEGPPALNRPIKRR